MNTQYFPNFIRTHYREIASEPNDILIEIGDEFKKYLEEKFAGKMEKLEPIWDISPNKVIHNMIYDPFSMKGYSPALILHFGEFIEKMKNSLP